MSFAKIAGRYIAKTWFEMCQFSGSLSSVIPCLAQLLIKSPS
jgi:hypothetical protein